MLVLLERTQRRICRSNTNMLFRRIEHVELLIFFNIIDFRRPEHRFAVRVRMAKRQSRGTFPVFEVFGVIDVKTGSDIRPVNIVEAVMYQDVRISQRDRLGQDSYRLFFFYFSFFLFIGFGIRTTHAKTKGEQKQ